MKQIIPSKIAEVIFALIIGYFGVNHFMNSDMLAGAVPSFMPADGKIWVYVTGAAFILAALAILTGMMKTLACYLLAILLIVIVLTIHVKGIMDAPEGMKMAHIPDALKDTAMAMAAILIGNNSSK